MTPQSNVAWSCYILRMIAEADLTNPNIYSRSLDLLIELADFWKQDPLSLKECTDCALDLIMEHLKQLDTVPQFNFYLQKLLKVLCQNHESIVYVTYPGMQYDAFESQEEITIVQGFLCLSEDPEYSKNRKVFFDTILLLLKFLINEEPLNPFVENYQNSFIYKYLQLLSLFFEDYESELVPVFETFVYKWPIYHRIFEQHSKFMHSLIIQLMHKNFFKSSLLKARELLCFLCDEELTESTLTPSQSRFPLLSTDQLINILDNILNNVFQNPGEYAIPYLCKIAKIFFTIFVSHHAIAFSFFSKIINRIEYPSILTTIHDNLYSTHPPIHLLQEAILCKNPPSLCTTKGIFSVHFIRSKNLLCVITRLTCQLFNKFWDVCLKQADCPPLIKLDMLIWLSRILLNSREVGAFNQLTDINAYIEAVNRLISEIIPTFKNCRERPEILLQAQITRFIALITIPESRPPTNLRYTNHIKEELCKLMTKFLISLADSRELLTYGIEVAKKTTVYAKFPKELKKIERLLR